jgi:macrolide-specific efflux system membrane fusion protein
MAVAATVITNIKNDVLLVPSSAAQTINGESTIRIMKGGKVSSVTVTTGDQNDTQIEITSGLSEGDSVVTGQTGGATTVTGGGTSTGGNRLFQSASPFGGGGSVRSVGTFNVVGGTTIRR